MIFIVFHFIEAVVIQKKLIKISMANSAQFDGGTILHHVTNWRDDVWIL